MAVRRRELLEGGELPSIREVARVSGLSPGTVGLAFRILRERGVIVTSHGKRARVSSRPVPHRAFDMRIPPGTVNLAVVGPDPQFLPNVNLLLGDELFRPTLYDEPPIEESLQTVMADNFNLDGIRGELTITNGALDALERLVLSSLRPGASIVVEDPSWGSSLSLLQLHNFELIGVSIDDEGLLPTPLAATLTAHPVAAILLTPRAQNPLGSAMTQERAAQLRAVLNDHPDVMVIEDDHASWIGGAESTTLTTQRQRFSVIRSLNKTLGPDLRVAAMITDPVTADAVQRRMLLGPGWVSHFVQRLAARLLTDTPTLVTVERAADAYASRRNALIAALAERGVQAHGRSGLNIAVPVPDETAVVSDLLVSGWAVRGGASFRLDSPPFIRICTARLPEGEADNLAVAIARAIYGGSTGSLAP